VDGGELGDAAANEHGDQEQRCGGDAPADSLLCGCAPQLEVVRQVVVMHGHPLLPTGSYCSVKEMRAGVQAIGSPALAARRSAPAGNASVAGLAPPLPGGLEAVVHVADGVHAPVEGARDRPIPPDSASCNWRYARAWVRALAFPRWGTVGTYARAPLHVGALARRCAAVPLLRQVSLHTAFHHDPSGLVAGQADLQSRCSIDA
jgi:hypothetical protein